MRCGSFRSAAERLELSINVVRRRIDDFERQIGATLFTRDVHGTRLTDEGALVVSRGRAHGSGVVRPAARQQFRRQYAVGRSPGRRHRGPWHVLAGPPPGRISAIVSRTFWSTCIARCARPTSRGMRPTLRSTCPGRPSLDVKLVRLGRIHLMFFAEPEIHRHLWRAANRRRPEPASAGGPGRRPDRRQGGVRKLVSRPVPARHCWS